MAAVPQGDRPRAVMGSKNLKAIVSLGKGQVNVADIDGLRKAIMDFYEQARDNGELRKGGGTGRGAAWPGQCQQEPGELHFKEGYSEAFVKYEDPEVIRDLIACGMRHAFHVPLPAASEAASKIRSTR